MIILAWDSSGSSQSVAIQKDGQVLTETWEPARGSQSETLLPTIQKVLELNAISLNQVDLFALSVGPGSFTGLRIGIATLKAFTCVQDKPVAAISSLDALTAGIQTAARVIPCLDARLAEVFTSGLGLADDQAVPIAQFMAALRQIPGEKCLVGSGALLHQAVLENIPHVTIPSDSRAHQIQAAVLARLGETMFRSGTTFQGRDVLPRYLRVSEAERKLESRI